MRARNKREVYKSRKHGFDWPNIYTALSDYSSCAQMHNLLPPRHEFIQNNIYINSRMTLTANAGIKKSFRARAVRFSPQSNTHADPVVRELPAAKGTDRVH